MQQPSSNPWPVLPPLVRRASWSALSLEVPWLSCLCRISGLLEASPHCPSSALPSSVPAHPMAPCFVFADDRHRVKLPPMMGGPDADYINANYIDVSASPSSLLASPCPL